MTLTLTLKMLPRPLARFKKRHACAHFGKNARIVLLEADAHFYCRLGAIRGWDHCNNFCGYLPVRIGIELDDGRLVWFDAIDEVFTDIHFNLKRIHVNDCADAGANRSACGSR